MSLVAYAASSDEESDNDNEQEEAGTQVQLVKSMPNASSNNNSNKKESTSGASGTSGHISDDDDDYIPQEVSLQQLKPASSGRLTLSLPKPKIAAETKADAEDQQEEEQGEQVTQAFAKLPVPRAAVADRVVIEEADDEFLHKKALPAAALEKPPPAAVKGRVKISIPSLRDFADVDKEKAAKEQGRHTEIKPNKGCGLLSILPQAKSERVFAKKTDTVAPATTASKATAAPAFVPDTVKLRRAAHNTEGVDKVKLKDKTPKAKPTVALVNASDSDDDEEEGDHAGDFFSLHKEQQLPEVSTNEISALVAKRAAKMVEASSKYFAAEEEKRDAEQAEAAAAAQLQTDELRLAQKRYHDKQLNAEAMDALVGKNAKRRRKEAKDMHVIDIVGTQVMPDREEWLRTALASETSFQPTGQLNDDESQPGTRRKHQITYLAHKAKANEAELQAMWSANRQTRRATQNKYGF